jgi:hypothetical protein
MLHWNVIFFVTAAPYSRPISDLTTAVGRKIIEERRKLMNYSGISSGPMSSLTLGTCAFLLALGGVAHAQSAKDLVGTWQLTSQMNTAANGAKTESFGANPLGLTIYTADGHYTQILTRPGISKVAANNRMNGTADENKAIVQGSIANFGTYSVQGNKLTLKMEGSTYPNWIGAEQTWNVSIKGNVMMVDLPSSSAGSSESTWKRIE